MDSLKFDCPKKLSQKFWSVCRDREETIGSALRNLMLREIMISDPEFREKLTDIFEFDDEDVEESAA